MDILILRKNGDVVLKDETKISTHDISNSEYFLINTCASTKNYLFNFIMIKPSILLLFTKAVIEYQMVFLYDDFDDHLDIDGLEPVRVETTSISKLICLLNSIDKLNVTNDLFQMELMDSALNVGLSYISVKLFQSDTVIYDKYYQIKDSSSAYYDSYKIAKHFKEIYDGNIFTKPTKNDEYVVLNKSHKKMKWVIDSISSSYDLISIPLLASNTLIICTKDMIETLLKYKKFVLIFTIYFSSESMVQEITNAIRTGETSNIISSILDNVEDIYTDNKKVVCVTTKTVGNLIDFIVNAEFSFKVLTILFSEIYDTKKEISYDFDAVLTIKLYDELASDKHKECTMNINTPLDPMDIINNL